MVRPTYIQSIHTFPPYKNDECVTIYIYFNFYSISSRGITRDIARGITRNCDLFLSSLVTDIAISCEIRLTMKCSQLTTCKVRAALNKKF